MLYVIAKGKTFQGKTWDECFQLAFDAGYRSCKTSHGVRFIYLAEYGWIGV